MINNGHYDLGSSRVLVVGGAGFVGSNLARLIIETSPNASVIVLDNLLSSELENVPSDARVHLRIGSISDDWVLATIADEFDYIFHLATYHGNQSSIYDPIADHENNTLTTLKLLNHVAGFKRLKKLVYSSAGCSVAKKTFDIAIPTTEEDPINLEQDSPYSISKIFGEFYAVYFHRQCGVPTVRARFQNVYGPGEILGAGRWRGTPATVWRNVVPTFIYKSLQNESLPVENEGIATRDFIFVRDICHGLLACAIRGKAGEVYNLGSGNEISIRQLAEKINTLTNNVAPIRFLPKRQWDNSGKRFASIEKSRKELQFEATTPLDQGLQQTVDWIRVNMSVIEKCIHRHDKYMN